MTYRIAWRRGFWFCTVSTVLSLVITTTAGALENTTFESNIAPQTLQLESESTPLRGVVSPVSQNQSLDELFSEKRQEKISYYKSKGYTGRVILILTALLGVFYLVSKFVLPRFFASGSQQNQSQNAAEDSQASFWKTLFGRPLLKQLDFSVTPKVLSRLRLSPAKEIHVIQIGHQRFVVGSTNQSMNLLAELDPADALPQVSGVSGVEEAFKKYLTTPAVTSRHSQEEI